MQEFQNAELAKYIASLAIAGQAHQKVTVAGSGPLLQIGSTIHNMEKYLDAPQRTREGIVLHDAASFIAYMTAFGSDELGTRIFFDAKASRFLGVVDYPTAAETSWGEHAASYKAEYSEEYTEWFEQHDKPHSQIGMCRFLEENLGDIVTPIELLNGKKMDAIDLLEMFAQFEATKNVAFKEGTRLRDGTSSISYIEEVTTGDVVIPDFFKIAIPVYFGQDPREITLRVRYKVEERKLTLRILFVRPLRVIQEAQGQLVSQVAAETSFPVHLGSRSPLPLNLATSTS